MLSFYWTVFYLFCYHKALDIELYGVLKVSFFCRMFIIENIILFRKIKPEQLFFEFTAFFALFCKLFNNKYINEWLCKEKGYI